MREITPQPLVEAKKIACRRWPWASEAIMFEMATVKRPGLGTMAVDQYWRMYYDPKFLEDKTTEEIASVVQHELCHLVFRHHKRGKFILGERCLPIDNRDWQWSTDAAINELLLRERFPLPGKPITRREIRIQTGVDVGKLPSAEEAYRKLQEARVNEPEESTVEFFKACIKEMSDDQDDNSGTSEDSRGSSGDGGPPGEESGGSPQGDGGDKGNRGDVGEPDLRECEDDNHDCEDEREAVRDACGDAHNPDGGSAEDTGSTGVNGATDNPSKHGDDGDGGGSGSTAGDDGSTSKPDPIAGNSGSCADGIPKPWELGPPEEDYEGVSSDREDIVLEGIAKNVLEGRGNVPGAISRWATEILDPAIDPRQHILNVIHKHVDLARGRGRRSYRRPNRRLSGSEFIMPTSFAPVPRITVCVDSSGSMRDTDKALAIGLINKVLSSFPNRRGIKVIVGDTKGRTTELAHSRLNRMKDVGGGGTDMGRLIEDAAKSDPVPQVILVATDGDTPWPQSNPGIPVLACLTRRGYEDRTPSWMKTLMISKEK